MAEESIGNFMLYQIPSRKDMIPIQKFNTCLYIWDDEIRIEVYYYKNGSFRSRKELYTWNIKRKEITTEWCNQILEIIFSQLKRYHSFKPPYILRISSRYISIDWKHGITISAEQYIDIIQKTLILLKK